MVSKNNYWLIFPTLLHSTNLVKRKSCLNTRNFYSSGTDVFLTILPSLPTPALLNQNDEVRTIIHWSPLRSLSPIWKYLFVCNATRKWVDPKWCLYPLPLHTCFVKSEWWSENHHTLVSSPFLSPTWNTSFPLQLNQEMSGFKSCLPQVSMTNRATVMSTFLYSCLQFTIHRIRITFCYCDWMFDNFPCRNMNKKENWKDKQTNKQTKKSSIGQQH